MSFSCKKVIALVLLFFAAFARSEPPTVQFDLPVQQCEFQVPLEVSRKSVKRFEELSTDDTRQLTLHLRLPAFDGKTAGRIVFFCPPKRFLNGGEVGVEVLSPRQIIEDEDSRGRYFRNVVWERPIAGSNWSGRIAYVDYLFGDGQKSYGPYLLMCHANGRTPCVEYYGESGSRLTRRQLADVLGLFRSLRYTRP